MKAIAEGLVRLADHLDRKGFTQEASLADEIIQMLGKKASDEVVAEDDLEVEENVLEKEGEEPAEEECMQEEALMPMKAMEEKAALRRRARREKLIAKIG